MTMPASKETEIQACSKPADANSTSIGRALLRDGLFPSAFYLTVFTVLTYPLLLSFSSRFFADDGDGRQTLWGIWWVNHAVLAGQSPWHTLYLHYPYGVSLLAHNLSPFNGFVAIVLLKFFSLVQAHNLIVISGFVFGGLTAFLLCRYISGAYWPSLAGGAIFTFSNYHFAHAEGHLMLVSLEFLPLFVLAWWKFLEKPAVKAGIIAGVTLFAVLFCDFYYFLFSVLTGVILFSWVILKQRGSLRDKLSNYLLPLAGFTLTALITCGPLIFGLLLLNATDPLSGAHSDSEYSLDLPSLLIPGGHWRFAELTRFYWHRLPGNINESSVDVGISVLLLALYGWYNRRRLTGSDLGAWYLIAVIFAIFSLGPTLRIWGRAWPVPLPYRILRLVIPPLKLTGVPVRMVAMVFLSCAVIAANSLKWMFEGRKWTRMAAAAIIVLMVLEYLPKPMSQAPTAVPDYVIRLAHLPGKGAVLDLAVGGAETMYNQTVHGKPLVFGYISRVPRSVLRKDVAFSMVLARADYQKLCHDYGIEYIVPPGGALSDLGEDCSPRPEAIADLDRMIDDLSVPIPQGSLIKGNGPAIYQVADDIKHEFTDFDIFLRYGGAPDLSNVILITDEQLAAIPEGQPIVHDEFVEGVQYLWHRMMDACRTRLAAPRAAADDHRYSPARVENENDSEFRGSWVCKIFQTLH